MSHIIIKELTNEANNQVLSKQCSSSVTFRGKCVHGGLKIVELTRFIVSLTEGRGRLGSDVWKLYRFGVCIPEKTFTRTYKYNNKHKMCRKRNRNKGVLQHSTYNTVICQQ